ncbi:EamA family transporter [Cellulomonas sp. H30R-01]|uniref:DMT family transporter n=1 Tax=Cellulomonas sp. H30R-01 TaxID=2704467 RepID=UPI00138DB8BB|nr:DMT family transporter [Cellulomonas sp. H30R-01]QHT57281.1 EamA family transporter [Cellulomonas sp. H30R-01]
MSAVAVVLVLTSSLAHAVWNLLVKRVPGGGPVFVWVYSVLSVVLLVPVAATVVVRGTGLTLAVAGASAVSAVLHMVYALALQWAYAHADMNVAYPVARGVGPLVVVAVAVVALHQRLTWLAVAGVVAILVGVAVVARGGAGPAGATTGSGAPYGVLVGVTIAGYTLWDDHAINVVGADPLVYYVGTAVLQCLVLTALCWRRRAQGVAVLRTSWRTAAAVAVLVPLSYVLVLVAMQDAPVALVATLRCTSIVFGSLAGWLLLGERSGPHRLAGAAVVLAGVGALVAPGAV